MWAGTLTHARREEVLPVLITKQTKAFVSGGPGRLRMGKLIQLPPGNATTVLAGTIRKEYGDHAGDDVPLDTLDDLMDADLPLEALEGYLLYLRGSAIVWHAHLLKMPDFRAGLVVDPRAGRVAGVAGDRHLSLPVWPADGASCASLNTSSRSGESGASTT
ncbi:hypothetical protein CYMTET_23165 [Cymbomonas tetramitiformis]|uniref:Uncharacterized protein n=1 Tax=Cymbomonas tetramitiformis TaxID=36881 RepID=A0AAE0L178_9CHLO|nr:hypothetical protein CYMTET_23165 [Cymbomonas tetramitiformis]